MNALQKEIYFVVLFFFDHSYRNFLKKNSFEEPDFIICYIPKLYRPKYYEVYEGLYCGSISPKSDSQSQKIKSPKKSDDEIDIFIKKKKKNSFLLLE